MYWELFNSQTMDLTITQCFDAIQVHGKSNMISLDLFSIYL